MAAHTVGGRTAKRAGAARIVRITLAAGQFARRCHVRSEQNRLCAGHVSGTRGPEVLAQLAKGALRRKLRALKQAPAGTFKAHNTLII